MLAADMSVYQNDRRKIRPRNKLNVRSTLDVDFVLCDIFHGHSTITPTTICSYNESGDIFDCPDNILFQYSRRDSKKSAVWILNVWQYTEMKI